MCVRDGDGMDGNIDNVAPKVALMLVVLMPVLLMMKIIMKGRWLWWLG